MPGGSRSHHLLSRTPSLGRCWTGRLEGADLRSFRDAVRTYSAKQYDLASRGWQKNFFTSACRVISSGCVVDDDAYRGAAAPFGSGKRTRAWFSGQWAIRQPCRPFVVLHGWRRLRLLLLLRSRDGQTHTGVSDSLVSDYRHRIEANLQQLSFSGVSEARQFEQALKRKVRNLISEKDEKVAV